MALAARSCFAQNPRMEVDDGSVNVRLERQDATFRVVRQQTIDVGQMEERLRTLETATIPRVAADAEVVAVRAAFNASVTSMSATAGQIAALQGAVNTIQTSLTSQISQMQSTILAQNSVIAALSSSQTALVTDQRSTAALLSTLNSTTAAALTTLTRNITTLENNPTSTIVGWTECTKRQDNPTNGQTVVVMQCPYIKLRDNTVLQISVNGNQRQIGGDSRWRMMVDNRQCRGPAGQSNGHIWTRFHGTGGVNLHRPVFLQGTCFRLDNGNPLRAGRHVASYMQYSVNGDSYYGWESTSRMRIEEWTLPETASPAYQAV